MARCFLSLFCPNIAADRLTPQGFGATRPKEPNDTLAGRARNRRVELVRE